MADDSRPSLAELRHTAAHVLAYAVQDLFPEAKPTIGPAIENGFYYDFDRAEPFTPDDLERLERRMAEIVAADYPMTGREVTRDDAIAEFAANPYKVEMAREIPEDQPITLYTIGEFTDLCRGGHAQSTGGIGAFKLTNVAGAYWRGDEHKPMLQRIYGTAWYDREELEAYLARLEEARRRDHRKLGAELDLFSIEEQAGGGLVFWHPKGAIVRGIIENFIREGLRERGYQPVVTPHIAHERLYEISGHLDNFGENMFGPIEVEGQRFRLKPMNCPGHILIYKDRLRSYRELPLRFSEFGTVYRFERSGVLHGLNRVRGFTQDDAHLFCMPDQLQHEFEQTLDEALRLMKAFGFVDFQYVLSTRAPEDRGETDAIAEAAIRNALERYGPSLRRRRRRRRFLRPETRHQRARRARTPVAARNRAGRLHFACSLRLEIPSRRRPGSPAGHDPSRPGRIARALLRHSHRALRRRLSGLAGAGSSSRHAHLRARNGVCS